MIVENQYGRGNQFVYAYYFPSQAKEKYKWPCKIGSAAKDYERRILQQQASMQEEPVIGALIRSQNCRRDEVIIHTALREDKLPTYGNEWYLTNPLDVINAIRFNHEDMTLGMRIRLARYDAGLSQAQLAESAGLRQPTISDLENDCPGVRLSTIQRCLSELKKEIVLAEKDPIRVNLTNNP